MSNNSPLEYLAKQYENVIRYDAEGNPSHFVRFNKMKSSDLDPSLPNHTHPAFIINGVEQNYILLGKYKGAEKVSGGTIYSIPNVPPARNLLPDDAISRMKQAGNGITGMTVADYGFLLLLAQKNGWSPNGNVAWDMSANSGTPWQNSKWVSVGEKRGFRGYLYTCLITHRASVELRPDFAPTYWKKGKHVGGVPYDDMMNAIFQTGHRTLNGSGPKDWWLCEDTGLLADIIGSTTELQSGYRVVNGEIQILPNNDAADPSADLSDDSAAWKAILPNQSDDGYTLVEPGTSGTLHWNVDANAEDVFLDNNADDGMKTAGVYQMDFSALTADANHLPYVPHIMRELGLFPTTGSRTDGKGWIDFSENINHVAYRGGNYYSGNDSGFGCVDTSTDPYSTGISYGCRPRALA